MNASTTKSAPDYFRTGALNRWREFTDRDVAGATNVASSTKPSPSTFTATRIQSTSILLSTMSEPIAVEIVGGRQRPFVRKTCAGTSAENRTPRFAYKPYTE